MHCQITHPFLRFSANPLLTEKKVRFFQEDRLVFSLNIPLTDREPTFFAYMDVRRFMGQTLTLSCEPEMAFEVVPCDEIPKEQDALRPQWHFTVQNGWTNDPNGMIYLDGVYHLFYQYNPCSTAWGNMHWGHATSTDLFHWTEQDTALFPDETGTMYSGGAVLDENNTSGLGTAEQPPVLLFYTAAGKEAVDGIPKPYAQYAAFSANRLQTVEKLPKPVLPHIEAENRDPKVVWCAELQRWVMSLFLDIGRYGLYTSENLLDWLPLQTLELEKIRRVPIFSA